MKNRLVSTFRTRPFALLAVLTLALSLLAPLATKALAGYGKCSACSCPGFYGSGSSCSRSGCGHHYNTHW